MNEYLAQDIILTILVARINIDLVPGTKLDNELAAASLYVRWSAHSHLEVG